MTNREAIGYLLLSCKELGLNKEQTKKLFGSMYNLFDLYTEDEAEKKGYEYYYSLEDEE